MRMLILKIKYRIRRCLVPLNDQHFPKFVRGLDNGDFYFIKNFKFFIKFFAKRSTGGLFDYTTSYLNRKNQK